MRVSEVIVLNPPNPRIIMKFLIRLLCLSSLLVGLDLRAQLPTSDDFSTDMRWQPITNAFLPKGDPTTTTTITGGQMNFVVTTATADDAAGRFWVPSVAPSDTNWTIDVYVNLGSLDLSTPGQYANLNLGVSFANSSMMVAIDRYNNGTQLEPNIVYAFDSYNTSFPLAGAYDATSDSLAAGTLRLAYTAASGGTLTAQFSNGLVFGGAYQSVGELNNVSGTWGMSPTDTFNIILVGASGTKGAGAGPTISSGTAYFDTFASSGLEARPAPVPEPSTYAAIIGMLALGFAIHRRRG